MLNIQQFINNNKSVKRNRHSAIQEALDGGAPAYISTSKRTDGMYFKIHFIEAGTGAVKSQLLKSTTENTASVIVPLIDKHGAVANEAAEALINA